MIYTGSLSHPTTAIDALTAGIFVPQGMALLVEARGTFAGTLSVQNDSQSTGWTTRYSVATGERIIIAGDDKIWRVVGALSSGTAAWRFETFVPVGTTNISWDDLRFPANAINPPGAASDPTRNTTNGLLEFSASQDNIIAGYAQFPHRKTPGSPVRPHMHIRTASAAAGNMVWKLEYRIGPATGAMSASTGSSTVTVANAGATGGNTVQIVEFDEVDYSQFTGSSVCMEWVVSRLGSDEADTYGGIATLQEFDIHYQSDRNGSGAEFV